MSLTLSPHSAATTRRAAPLSLSSVEFSNPIAPGADPWVVRHNGWYYWCLSEAMQEIVIFRSATLTELGEKVCTWSPPATGPHSREIWAPELHCLDGRWFIYVAACDGRNETHRMIVLEADRPDGPFTFRSELYTGDDYRGGAPSRWAIDGTVLTTGGRRYFVWSGWESDRDEQWLYIAAMENPWTIASDRVRLCANDDHLWERVDESPAGRGLNEGPQVLQRGGRTFIVYSASGSWQTSYKLGMLELLGDRDPLQPSSWRKFDRPVLAPDERTWGVGHCSFVRSPDETEDWIAFHAKVETRDNWNRAIHVQRFFWDDEHAPIFGAPRGPGMRLTRPSGELLF